MRRGQERNIASTALTAAAWLLVVPLLVWAVVRLLGLEGGYPYVQLIAYTPYVLALSLLALLVVVLMRRWMPAIAAALAVFGLAVAVLPRAVGSADEASDGKRVQMISFNLARGKADLQQLLEVVGERDIDLLSLQEVTRGSAAEMRRLGFAQLFPHRIIGTREDPSGGALLSKYPLEYVGRPKTLAIQPRALVRVPGAELFELMSVHPHAPAGPRTTPRWSDDYELMPAAGEAGPPKVLAGDFNATLDHRKLRDLIDTGYRNAGDVVGSGLVPTWPGRLQFPPPVTIDHFLAEPPIGITGYDVVKIRSSDHRAIFVELSIPAR